MDVSQFTTPIPGRATRRIRDAMDIYANPVYSVLSTHLNVLLMPFCNMAADLNVYVNEARILHSLNSVRDWNCFCTWYHRPGLAGIPGMSSRAQQVQNHVDRLQDFVAARTVEATACA